jgi:hypothetical protein
MTDIVKDITPALTAEEWKRAGDGGQFYIAWDGWLHAADSKAREYLDASLDKQASGNRHALAALALHRQPFGFTWEMAAFLRARCFFESHGIGCGDEAGKCLYCEIADRIAALLPPRE